MIPYLEKILGDFFKNDPGNYYAIMCRDRNYFTMLKVEDIENAARKTREFISEHIGNYSNEEYSSGNGRVDFTVGTDRYHVFNYDAGTIVI